MVYITQICAADSRVGFQRQRAHPVIAGVLGGVLLGLGIQGPAPAFLTVVGVGGEAAVPVKLKVVKAAVGFGAVVQVQQMPHRAKLHLIHGVPGGQGEDSLVGIIANAHGWFLRMILYRCKSG